MARFEYPLFQAFDSNGDPLSGAWLFSYYPGTTTAKSLYTDSLLTTPETNPVILDTRGEAAIYGSGGYKLVLTNIGTIEDEVYTPGTTIWTMDGVYGISETEDVLLSTTTVPLNADNAGITIYTVPTGRRCVPSKAVLVSGGDARASTTITIGQVGALTDFIGTQTLSNLDAAYDAVTLMPIPNATPVKQKSYAAETVIKAVIASQSGDDNSATSQLYFFGFLY